jgi:ERO1-like protein beta
MWVVDKEQFMKRVGFSDDRISSLFCLHLQLAKAVRFILPKLFDYDFLSESQAEAEISRHSLLAIHSNLKQLVQSKPIFLKNTKKEIVNEFRQRFMKVSMIMDCITCEKCRLWGKLQSLGIGTSFKILFALESKGRWSRLRLRNPEIIALFNTFARVSESIKAVTYFRELYLEDSCLLVKGFIPLVFLVMFIK